MEPVQQRVEELLRVVLLVARELRGKLGQASLERPRGHAREPPTVHLLQQRPVLTSHLALATKRVLLINFSFKVTHKELSDLVRVHQTLQTGRHEAGIPEVIQPTLARQRVLPRRGRVVVIRAGITAAPKRASTAVAGRVGGAAVPQRAYSAKETTTASLAQRARERVRENRNRTSRG